MKKIPLIILTLLLFKTGFSQSIPTDSLYLGQIPPGNTPKIFKLPVDSGLLASDKISITKDGKKIYYREVNPSFPGKVEKIKYLTYVNNRWTGPFNLFESFGPFALSITEDTIFLGGSWIFTPDPSVSREVNLKN